MEPVSLEVRSSPPLLPSLKVTLRREAGHAGPSPSIETQGSLGTPGFPKPYVWRKRSSGRDLPPDGQPTRSGLQHCGTAVYGLAMPSLKGSLATGFGATREAHAEGSRAPEPLGRPSRSVES